MGLGVWAYQLNTRLTATQKQLASLQTDYNKLKADNAQLTTDLAQTNATLEQTKSDLAKSQSDLKTANNDKAAQRTKMDTAKNLMTVVDAIWVTAENNTGVTSKIKATGDARLSDLWSAFVKTPSAKGLADFDEYLFGAIDNVVKSDHRFLCPTGTSHIQ